MMWRVSCTCHVSPVSTAARAVTSQTPSPPATRAQPAAATWTVSSERQAAHVSQCGDTCSTRGSVSGDSDSYRDVIQSVLTQSPGSTAAMTGPGVMSGRGSRASQISQERKICDLPAAQNIHDWIQSFLNRTSGFPFLLWRLCFHDVCPIPSDLNLDGFSFYQEVLCEA